jgi:hypothetical protein
VTSAPGMRAPDLLAAALARAAEADRRAERDDGQADLCERQLEEADAHTLRAYAADWRLQASHFRAVASCEVCGRCPHLRRRCRRGDVPSPGSRCAYLTTPKWNEQPPVMPDTVSPWCGGELLYGPWCEQSRSDYCDSTLAAALARKLGPTSKLEFHATGNARQHPRWSCNLDLGHVDDSDGTRVFFL